MTKSYLKYFFIGSIILVFASSCLVEPKFPVEPKITFKSFEQIIGPRFDTLAITFDYRDGDGDLGLNQPAEEDPKFDPQKLVFNPATGLMDTITNPDFYNIIVDYFYLNDDNEFVPVPLPDGLVLNSRFPRLNNDGKAKPLEGEMTFFKEISPGFKAIIEGKVLRARVYIKDRSLNQSNVIETDSLLIQ